jgi:MoxR-like ATPase
MNRVPDDLLNQTETPSKPVKLFAPPKKFSDFEGYKPDKGLVDAIEVALLLRKPLVLTGRPGTGKTELGHYLGWKMNLPVYQFDAKSTSVARDLFYVYDAIRHFRAGGDIQPFLTFTAMGQAILDCANKTPEVVLALPKHLRDEPRRSVVVIDEVDKTPRDFPNDILNEIDNNCFRIPELANLEVRADLEWAPVVVITSNSEKNLPAAFLRRCVYYHVPVPEGEELKKIVSRRVAEFASPDGELLKDMVARFELVAGKDSTLRHPPSTSELLDWARALIRRGAQVDRNFSGQAKLLKETLGALIKSDEDLVPAKELLQVPSE